jgi:hypothetical protein
MMLSMETSGTDNQAEQARTLVREVTQIFGAFNISDFIGFCKNFDIQGFKKRASDIHKRYDALLEKIISDREGSRRKTKVIEGGCENGDERLKDFLDILLDVLEEKDLEVNFTRNHIKSLILVRIYIYLLPAPLSFHFAKVKKQNHTIIYELSLCYILVEKLLF